MSEQPVPRRYSLGISSIPPVEDADDGAEAEAEAEPADEDPPEP